MAVDLRRVELPLKLPEDPAARSRRVQALVARLQSGSGVTEAYVRSDRGDGPAWLCVNFEPDQVSVGELRALAGDGVLEEADRFTLWLAPLPPAAAADLSQRLRAEPGVIEGDASPSGRIEVRFDPTRTSEAVIGDFLARAAEGTPLAGSAGAAPGAAHADDARASGAHPHDRGRGQAASGRQDHGHSHGHGGVFGERTELVFALLSGLFLLVGWLGSSVLPAGWPLAFYVISYGFGGWFTSKEALDNLRQRRFAIDTLMLVAAAGAAALGEWAEGALLLVLFSLGHALEHYAMGRARRAIEALAELAPERATRKRGDQLEDVPVGELEVGDVVLVRPNERLAADGLVVAGTSSVNQAPVTGESVPVDKRPITDDLSFDKAPPEHRVFAGTINGAGALEVRVERKATETTLARVVTMVAEAEAQRSPTQRFTDRFERIFVPAVLAAVAALMFAGLIVDEPFSASFYRAMAVLVAASPCALAISVPSAVLSGVARAGRGGVLVKGGGPLENLGTLTAIAFDKTGTLTEGRPRVTDIEPALGVSRAQLLEPAVAVESQSDHPLAAAVVEAGRAWIAGPPPKAEAVESLTGQGVRGRVGGHEVVVGKPGLFEDLPGGLPEEVRAEAHRLARDGRTVIVVRRGEAYLGVLGLLDTPREGAAEVIQRLRSLGLRRIVMLSGDNQGVADAIATRLGLSEAKGGMMPEDKVAFIKEMREKEGLIAMVGDGVNDAPAMANATVGIAMGAAGSDVALETADVALMADDLRRLPFAVGLSRTTSRIIRQNLWASLGMVAFLIPATLLGLKIGAAVIFHEGSTLLVVANALRLLGYREARV
ncbi:heavy metal translocating P-type ATPase [Phenylobacterium sp.]|uniref:heavy metal translocating P-type ATPase n=1 Tax=Phenylobacterium sp. TaxID=1871053 RepID=UPI003918C04B